jgi:hypothetical protein
MGNTVKAFIIAAAIGLCGSSEARTIRATDMTPELWAKSRVNMADNIVVEFRQGDQLPVNISTMGDFIQSNQLVSMSVTVQRNFWLMLQNNDVKMSLDGTTFKEIQDLVTGGISADATSGKNAGDANGIDIVFAAFLK